MPPPTSPAFGWDPVEFTVNGVPAGSGNVGDVRDPDRRRRRSRSTSSTRSRRGWVDHDREAGHRRDRRAGPGSSTVLRHARLRARADLRSWTCRPTAVPPRTTSRSARSARPSSQRRPAGSSMPPTPGRHRRTCRPTRPSPSSSTTPSTISVVNEIVRVTAPVHLVKTYSGPQDVIDPARTYPVHWSCTYDGAVVAEGDELIQARTRAVSPSPPTFRSRRRALPPRVISGPRQTTRRTVGRRRSSHGTTVDVAGANTITVANTLTRDTGRVIVRKVVTGATEGYIGTGPDFTLHGQCSVPATRRSPSERGTGRSPTGARSSSSRSASAGRASASRTRRASDLLLDDSYAWGPAMLDPPGTSY